MDDDVKADNERVMTNADGIEIRQRPGRRPGTWEVVMTPELEDYLRKTPRRAVDIPGVTQRTVDTLRKRAGATTYAKSDDHWYLDPAARRVIANNSISDASKILGKTEDSIGWARRCLGIETTNNNRTRRWGRI